MIENGFNMSIIPQTWIFTRLKEICTITDRDHRTPQYVEKGIPLISPKNFTPNGIDFESVKFVGKEELENFERKCNPEIGDILYSRIGTIGEARPVNFGSYFVALHSIAMIKPDYRITNSEFILYLLKSANVKNQALLNVKSVGTPDLGLERMNNFQIPLAPLPEQQRIVAKIEELFTKLDVGIEALYKVKAQLKRYRQAVLKHAFEGKLTAEWRKTSKDKIENTLPLPEQIGKEFIRNSNINHTNMPDLATIDSPKLPYGWAHGKLEDYVYIAGRIGWRGLKAEEYTEDGPLFLSVHNLNKGKYVDFSDSYHISEERYIESPEIQLKNDDILLVKDGAGIGKLGIVRNLDRPATVNSSILVIRAGKSLVSGFLYYLLMGPEMQAVVRAKITGSATPHLFQRDIKKFELLIPAVAEQSRITEEIDRLYSLAEDMERIIDESLEHSARLRQSILRKAFEGKLVPQDLSDEPADTLLQRIREERAKQKANDKKSKGKKS